MNLVFGDVACKLGRTTGYSCGVTWGPGEQRGTIVNQVCGQPGDSGAPVTVNNFIVLALNGYYNGSSFWDSEDWVVQAGDPNGNGTGGPGYNLPEEPAPFLKWNPGSVGMARIPGGPINGSQANRL